MSNTNNTSDPKPLTYIEQLEKSAQLEGKGPHTLNASEDQSGVEKR